MTFKPVYSIIVAVILIILLAVIIHVTNSNEAEYKMQRDNQQHVVQLVSEGIDPIIANCAVYGFGHGGAKERYNVCLKAVETRGLTNGKETRE